MHCSWQPGCLPTLDLWLLSQAELQASIQEQANLVATAGPRPDFKNLSQSEIDAVTPGRSDSVLNQAKVDSSVSLPQASSDAMQQKDAQISEIRNKSDHPRSPSTPFSADAKDARASSRRRKSWFWRRSGLSGKNDSSLKVMDPKPRLIQTSPLATRDQIDPEININLLHRFKKRITRGTIPSPSLLGDTAQLKIVLVGDGACGKTCFVV